MNVVVSVRGRFHAFHLAVELQRHQCLQRLITSYPMFAVAKYGVERGKITSLSAHELLSRVGRYLPVAAAGVAHSWFCDFYDRHAASRLPDDMDIFTGWSGFSLHSLRHAKQRGAKTVVERGSSHILYQRDIMLEEYQRWGMRPRVASLQYVEKELAEYEEADFISIPSQYVKETFLARSVPPQKFIHIPYGVDLQHFRPVPKQDTMFRVIHCGTLSLQKGVHYLLQAFWELDLPGAELWLIGGITEEIRPFLTRYASAKIAHKGPFPEFQLHELYSQGSVFCLASIQDGFGMVQIQAMACGLPAICTTNTGGPDIVRQGIDGFVIPIRDVEALKEKLLFFYENPEARAAMGDAARQRVQSGFTWADYGDRMVTAYQRILGEA